jgi:nucleotidyltransferase/DNA polymerase involved in DNA repair
MPAPRTSKSHSKNMYLHADGDSFFVACELSVRPELRGKPVIVGGDRGIAVAMSTEAKKLGVTRGMPVFRIKKFFPEVVILPHHFDLYNDISERMHRILSSYFDKIEVYSIDECFALVDPSEIKYFGGEEKLLRELKQEIEQTLGVTYSLGLARTKALSKLASKLEKPAGVVMLLNKKAEEDALKNTPIDDIWGIGRRTIPRLKRFGLNTALDFVNFPEARLESLFFEPLLVLKRELAGEEILRVASDTDPRDQKSIQATATFRPASTDIKIIWREISENAEHACQNARDLHLVSNSVSFFVKTSEFKYYFDDAKLPLYTADPGVILNAVESKLPKLLKKRERIRSTGVILHNLIREEAVPLDLFGRQEKELKNLKVEEAADRIRAKHGSSAIKRASSIEKEAGGETKNRKPHSRGKTF